MGRHSVSELSSPHPCPLAGDSVLKQMGLLQLPRQSNDKR
jgi:hypothetical protein